MAPLKRKALEPQAIENKRPRVLEPDPSRYKDSANEIKYGIVLRKYYPPEMVNQRANDYSSGKIERPIEALRKAQDETQAQRDVIPVGESVVHWFKCDTRLSDNKALHFAAEKAKSKEVPLICIYIVSPQDFEAHLTAPVRVDFILRNLEVLKADLRQLDIPLYVETVEKRRQIPTRILELCQQWGARHLYCNAEYEVDELRREAGLTRTCLEKGISFNVYHDTCVVEPGKLSSNAGGQISVYSPWHRKWCAYLNTHPHELDVYMPPDKNPASTMVRYRELFTCSIPEAPASKSLTEEERRKFHSMWPAGEHEAQTRLHKFLTEKVKEYHTTRNLPSGNGTSVLSPHLAAGTLSTRTVVRVARDAAPNKTLTDDRKQGHSMWMGEVAWRDFYKHVLCHWPYIWYVCQHLYTSSWTYHE
jgi:deoxyribodipyrimidine photo-lyase